MKSRERVLKAINFEEPDRVPIDLGGTTGASGIHLAAYKNLKSALGFPEEEPKCCDVMQQLALVEPEVLEKLHGDVIQLSPVSLESEWTPYPLYRNISPRLPAALNLQKNNGEWVLKNKAGKIFLKPDSSWYFDAQDGLSWFSYEYDLTDEFLDRLRVRAKSLYENTDFAIGANFGGGFGNLGDPEFLMDIITEPEKINEEMDKQCDSLIKKYKLLNEAIGDYVFCFVFANDFGSQNAPMISPETFDSTFKKHYKKFTDWLHTETDVKLFLHSCGAVEPLMESFIEMGVDILNPVQTSANGMEPEKLKEKYGGRIVFWGGGCDTQNVLGFKPQEKLIEHVKERIKIFAPGGGFIFNQVHAIQPAVLPEEIIAMFQTAYEFGKYPVI
jgi:uroporphyrinogen decarboxylase